MLEVNIETASGIIVIEPRGKLRKEDFKNLSRIVDTYLEEKQRLHGVMIHAAEFPGWDSFAAFVDHIRFVRDHHKRIEKVALVTDSPVGKLAPVLSGHFVKAEVKHFAFSAVDDANDWLSSP